MNSSHPESDSRPRSRVWLWTIGILAVVVALIVWLSLHGTRPPSPTAGGPGAPPSVGGGSRRGGGARALTVGVQTVKRGTVNVYLNQLGTVTSLATSTVVPQIAGQLMQVRFKEGDTVKVGTPLALIDPRPYEAQLTQYEGTLQHDQALLDNARRDLARYKTLIEQQSTSQQVYDTQVALVAQYEGTVKTDEGQVATAKLDIAYCNVVSPISGRVGLRQVDVGNYITTGSATGLVVVTQLQPISVVFTVPEDAIDTLREAESGGKPLTVEALDRAQVKHLGDGKVSALDNQIDTSTGTVKLRALFQNTDNAFFPNQFVNVKVLIKTLSDVPVLPTSAIERGTAGAFVYVIQPDKTAKMQVVKLGPTEGERVVVESGVNEGDVVVTDGADQVKDGQAVTIATRDGHATTPPAGASSASAPSSASSAPSGRRKHAHDDAAPAQ
jgi:multidrug efflux system membrane fusion protein